MLATSQAKDKPRIKLSSDGQEYLDVRTKAAKRIASLRARAEELDSAIGVCDLIYGRLLAGDGDEKPWLALSTATNNLQEHLGVAQWN